jgi:hypothetical protein
VTDVWVYEPLTPDGVTIDECLLQLCDLLRPHVAYLRDLARHYRVSVKCSCASRNFGGHAPMNIGGVRLGCECLRAFAELGISLHVGLTHFHDAVNEPIIRQ